MQDEPKRKRLVGAILLFAVMGLCGHVMATQYFAHQIHYEDAFLGEPLMVDRAAGVKIYAPHRIYTWSEKYRGQGVDDLLDRALLIASVWMAMAGSLCTLLLLLKKKAHVLDAHGSARWATDKEIKERGMLRAPTELIQDAAWCAARRKDGDDPKRAASSICFARTEQGEHYYSHDVTHTLAFAPTRSGKGVGMVIPSLLTWTESTVVTDIKGENFQRTGWWRSLFSHVVYFNPTDPNSARFNPLLEVRKGVHAIQDAMNLSTILGARPQGKENPFWDGGGRDVLTATILYVLYTQEKKSLGMCIRCLMRSQELFEEMQLCDVADVEVRQHLRDSATSFLEQDDKVRGGWVASAMGYLSLWKDPMVDRATSESDFRLRDIQYAKHPMSVFLVIPPGDIERLSPLVRLFFQQLTDVLTVQLEEREGEHRHRLLMLMDEFPQFGNMSKIEQALAYTAGYGIKWFLITQGLPQLAKIYGPHHSFIGNCHIQLAYRCNDHDNALALSKHLGDSTAQKAQKGEAGKKNLLKVMNQQSVSQVEFKRELMTPNELMTMDSERVLVLEAGQHPIKAHKLAYYKDEHFIPRYKNKLWDFPSSPLHDFPSSVVVHDWGTSSRSKSSAPESATSPMQDADASSPSTISMQELHDKKVDGGEVPVTTASVLKLESEEMQELAIPEEMSGKQAALHLTTTSIRKEHIDELLAKGLRAGVLKQDQLDAFLGSLEEESAPCTPLPKEAPSTPEPSPPSQDASPQEMLDDLDAFLGLVEELVDEAPVPPADMEEEDPSQETAYIEGFHARMEEVRAQYEALQNDEEPS